MMIIKKIIVKIMMKIIIIIITMIARASMVKVVVGP